MKRRVFAMSGGVLVVFALTVVEISRADPEDQAEGRTITYTGYLEQAGSPATGSRNLSFRLFDAETGGEELWPLSEDGTARVSFSAGRFTVELGGNEMDSLPSAAFTEPELWLEVSVEGTRLGGRQRVGTARHAVYAALAERASILDAPRRIVVTSTRHSGRITSGALVGYPAARAICQAVMGSPTAHLCYGSELTRARQSGLSAEGGASVTTTTYAFEGPTITEYTGGATGTGPYWITSDCGGFTSTASDPCGTNARCMRPTWNDGPVACSTETPLLCCD